MAPKRDTPLPVRPMVVVLFVQLSEASQMTILFPFVAFMVASFDGVTEEMVGLYSGLVAASFAFGQVCSSYAWGRISDRFGARRCVLFSLTMNSLCLLAFGFSQNVAMAVLTRFATGVFNGNIGIIKSYLGKVTDSSNSSHAMALLSGAWSFGTIMAPMIGGFFSNPADQYPESFSQDSFFGQFPYALPCIIGSVISMTGLIACYFVMQDTDEAIQAIEEQKKQLAMEEESGVVQQSMFERLKGCLAPKRPGGATLDRRRYSHVGDGDDANDNDDDGGEELSTQSTGEAIETVQLNDLPPKQRPPFPALGSSGIMLKDSSHDLTKAPEPEHYKPPSLRLVWFCTMMYGLVALLFIWVDEIFPLFCRESPDNGGLGFTAAEIGTILIVLGAVGITYNLFFFKPISKRVGVMRLLRISTLLMIPILFAYPSTHYLLSEDHPQLVWIALVLILTIRAVLGLNLFTPVMVFVNNSVPREKMGMANGIGQTWASSVRAFGPAMGGLIWSFTANATFPMHSFLVWFLAIFLCIALLTLTFRYPASIDAPFVKVEIDGVSDVELATINTELATESEAGSEDALLAH